MEYVLQTNALTKVYGGKKVLDNVTMNVKKGAIYGFIGKNGAGKTTLMRIVTGLANPSSGSFTLFQSDDVLASRARTGCIIENPALYPNMTARKNLEYYSIILGITDKSIIDKMLALVGLLDTGKKKTKNFSLGMKQRLSIAIALLSNPDFLILDEPINGLDPMGIVEIRDLFLKLNQEQNITILISSHILGELAKIATCYGIINNGVLVDEFTSEELEQRCKQSVLINVDDATKASYILETECKITEFEILPNNTIKLFEHLDETDVINTALVKNDVTVKSISTSGQDLEEYFMDLMGGIK